MRLKNKHPRMLSLIKIFSIELMLSGLLTLIFTTLKITGVITWAWFFVLSPIPIFWLLMMISIAFLIATDQFFKEEMNNGH